MNCNKEVEIFKKNYFIFCRRVLVVLFDDCTCCQLHNNLKGTTTTTHKHTHNRFTAVRILFRTTKVRQYQKKHSPTHTYRGHQSSLICFLHLLPCMASSLFTCLTVCFYNFSPSFLWSTSWPGTLHFILHAFLHPFLLFAAHAHIIASCML